MILYTVANGIYKFGEDQQFIPLDSLYLPNPNSLIIDRNNTYWIGTYNTGWCITTHAHNGWSGLIYRRD